MTVSDWSSAATARGVSGFGQGFAQATSSQYYHPAHGGPQPQVDAQAPPSGVYAHAAAPGAPGPQGRQPWRSNPTNGSDTSGGALNILGAVVSVALVVGLGVWGYKLAMRDVTGVPVVRALEGPMRIQPEDPGGAVAMHQGLAVNDVAADEVTEAPVDSVMLSPPVTELAEEDVPAHPQVEVTSLDHDPVVTPSTGGEINADAAVAEALGLTDAAGDDGFFDTPIVVIPESVPGVTRSPRPMPRPQSLSAVGVPAVTPVATLAATTEATPAPIPAPIPAAFTAAASTPPPARPATLQQQRDVVLGQELAPWAVDPNSRLVQLGTYGNLDEARTQWNEFARLNPVLFHERDWTIEQSESGGAPFFRLRATGFADIDDARAFCAALVAGQGRCVPVLEG